MTDTPPAPPGSAPAAKSFVRSFLRDVAVDIGVGMHPWEQHKERPSRVLVSVEMGAALANEEKAADRFIDYDPVRAELREWYDRPHTPKLETLADELIELCFANPNVEWCRVSLTKPDIFNEAAGAGVEVFRTRPAAA